MENVVIQYDARPLYRISKAIAYKDAVIRRGSLHRLEKVPPKGIEKLKERGTITEVGAPPLEILPGWERRAEKLEQAGIIDVVQFLGADEEQAAQHMKVKPATIQRWKGEVMTWLIPGELRR